MKIHLEDFKRLCRVEDGEEDGAWTPWLSVREDGVYLKIPDESYFETFPELRIAYEFPASDPSQPVLKWGCSVEDFERFLEDYSVYGCVDPFDLLQWLQDQKSQKTGLKKQSQQDDAILAAISRKGIDPMRFPPQPKGRPGTKSEIGKEMLSDRSLFQSMGVFNKAWDRLRGSGRIKDA